MNTITRLSGWSSSAAAAGAANGGDGSPSRRSSSTTRQQQQQEERNGSSLNDSVPLSSRSAASIDAMPSSSRAPNTSNPKLPACSSNVTNDCGDGSRAEAAGDGARGSPKSVLKPPEPVLHEELEAAGAATCMAAGSSSEARAAAASAAAYPSPPPTPPLPERQDAMGASDVSAQTEELLTGHVPSGEKIGRKDGAEPLYLRPDKLHTASTSLTASSPGVLALAQAYPIKCLTRLYMLIRRFLALFGIRVDDSDTQQHSMSQPTAASIVPATQPGLPPRPSRDAPPSYADATANEGGCFMSTDTSSENHNGSSLPPAAAAGQKRPRWRFPGLSVPMVGKKRRPSFPTTDSMSSSRNGEDEGEPGTSSDSSSVRAARIASSPTAFSSTSDGDTPIQQPSSGPPSSVAHERRPRRMSHANPAGHRSKPSVSIAQRALSRPKLLVLDLDETLIHSTSRMGVSAGYSAVTSVGGDTSRLSTSGLKVRVVEVVLDGRSVVYHVYKRPWVDFFLRKVSAWYTVVIFTASMREYADPVIDWLDADGRGGMIATRLFRESCTYVNGSYVKDLRIVDPDLARVCLVDNSPISYAKDQANGIPIEGWINDPNDEALLDLLPMLDSLRFTNDVRHVLGLRLATTSTVLPEIDGTSAGNGSGVTKPRRQHRTSLTSLGPAELADLRSRR